MFYFNSLDAILGVAVVFNCIIRELSGIWSLLAHEVACAC